LIIQIENFYNTQNLYEVVKDLQFKENTYGEEIVDFNLVPENLHKVFGEILNQEITITKESGILRKPFENIHFESFNQNSLWVCIIPLEKTTFKLHRHKEKNYSNVMQVQEELQVFIKENCFNKENWNDSATFELNAGDMVMFKPFLWHSISKNLVKVFYLEAHVNTI